MNSVLAYFIILLTFSSNRVSSTWLRRLGRPTVPENPSVNMDSLICVFSSFGKLSGWIRTFFDPGSRSRSICSLHRRLRQRVWKSTYELPDRNNFTVGAQMVSLRRSMVPSRLPSSSQTEISSLLTPNVPVARKYISNQVSWTKKPANSTTLPSRTT